MKPKCIECGEKLANYYAKRCSTCWYKYSKGENNPNWKGGRSDCIDCGIKTGDHRSTRCANCSRRYLAGSRNGNWRGGVTSLNEKIRKSDEYIQWRKSVFERDKWTCVLCGEKKRDMQADHIKPFAFYPELRFDITNGRTLCKECHRNTITYGLNPRKKELYKYA